VHIIDGVLLPPAGPPTPAPPPSPPKPTQTIVDLAAADPDFSTLVTALKAAGLVDTLNGPGPFTVLAPTNKAFDTLPAGALANLLKPENKAALVSLLTYHVLPGSLDNFTRNGNKKTTHDPPRLVTTLWAIHQANQYINFGMQGRTPPPRLLPFPRWEQMGGWLL